jgi:hypothetical protein
VALSALVVARSGAVEAGVVAGLADTGSVHVVAGVALAGVGSGDGGVGAAGEAAVGAARVAGEAGHVAQVAVAGDLVLVVAAVAGADVEGQGGVGLATGTIIGGVRVASGAEDVAVPAGHLLGQVGAWGVSVVATASVLVSQSCVADTGSTLMILSSGTCVTISLAELAVSIRCPCSSR